MKKNVFHLALLFQLLLFLNFKAQNTYSFGKITNNPYADLVGDVNVPAFDNATGLSFLNNFQGETFKFFDVPFTFGGLKTITVGKYPFLRIDNDSSLVIVDAAFTYADTIDATTKISYLVQGTAGNRILKIQYKNFKLSYGQAGNFINVQIWYYQQTGVIEIHYGPRSANNVSGYTISSGPNVGIFYSPDDFSTCYQKLWVNGSPGNLVLDSAATLVFEAMSGMPDEGTLFRFTPRSNQPVATGLSKNSVLLNMEAYPNPANEKINFKAGFGNSDIEIYSMDGRLVKQIKNISAGAVEINVSDLPPGFYSLKTGLAFKKITIAH